MEGCDKDKNSPTGVTSFFKSIGRRLCFGDSDNNSDNDKTNDDELD